MKLVWLKVGYILHDGLCGCEDARQFENEDFNFIDSASLKRLRLKPSLG